jgi:hypothetical protein
MSSPLLRALPASARRARSARVRAAVVGLVGSALLVASTAGPASAGAALHHRSPLTVAAGPTRPMSRHYLASAKVAGRNAIGSSRNVSPPRRSPRRIPIDHPVTRGGGGLPNASSTVAAPAPAAQPFVPVVPQLAVAQRLTGITQAEAGFYFPPDPWVAVSSTYVVQAVNVLFRISNRSGAEISSIPAWALFSLPPGQFSSDQRIIWDAVHGRWVAIAISFNEFQTQNYLNLAVSDGADPTAGWTTINLFYGDAFPDFPSVASSSDKIVVTDNLFDPDGFFFAADVQTFSWASILAGTSRSTECLLGGAVTPRAAQVLSPSADVHMILEAIDDQAQVYVRVHGAASCDETGFRDSTILAFAPFAVPPEPRQSPGDTISHAAVDERPTDAIWQNNRLYWVSTVPVSYDLGATFNDAVAIWSATTQPTTGLPTEGPAYTISAGDGIDDFMGGIGLTRSGTLVTIYSESSPATFISMEANRIPDGGVLGTPLHLDDGDATYPDERWGDFAGVAMDPVGTGSVWATHEVAASDGTWRTDVFRLVVDNDLPGLPGTMTAAPVIPSTVGSSVATQLAWPAAVDGMTNVARYEIAQQIDGGGFVQSSNATSPSTIRPLLIGHTYQFEVRAIDAVGQAGGWRVSPTFRPYLTQSTSSTTTSGTWHTTSSSSYSGGSTRYATASGARITFTATSARSIAIVTTKATSRGSFKVYVDDVYKATISTYSTMTKFRQLVYEFRWTSPGTHKVKIVVSGTAHHPRVDVDAFVVMR